MAKFLLGLVLLGVTTVPHSPNQFLWMQLQLSHTGHGVCKNVTWAVITTPGLIPLPVASATATRFVTMTPTTDGEVRASTTFRRRSRYELLISCSRRRRTAVRVDRAWTRQLARQRDRRRDTSVVRRTSS